jgi:hypothetical protein
MQSHDTKNYNSTVGINVGTIMTTYKNSLLNHENIYTFDFCRGHHFNAHNIPHKHPHQPGTAPPLKIFSAAFATSGD